MSTTFFLWPTAKRCPRDTQRVSEEGEKALKNWQRRQKCVFLRENECEREKRKMTDPVVHIQVDPTNSPSTPPWFGEVAVVAHAFQRYGGFKAIQERWR